MSRPVTRKPCPLCGKPPSPAHAPFCGKGCRDRDLLNWMGEGYRVPGHPVDPAQDRENGLDSTGPAD